MPIYLEDTKKSFPHSKIYLGRDLVYQKNTYIDTAFSSCPFPTSWTTVTSPSAYKSTNEFGTWNITSEMTSNSTYNASTAFDKNTSSYWCTEAMESGETAYLTIESPVLIRPKEIYIKHRCQHPNGSIQGFNPTTNSWIVLHNFLGTVYKNGEEENVTVETEIFFSKFRARCRRYSSSYTQPQIYEFQITSGTIRQSK